MIPSYPEVTSQDLYVFIETKPFSNVYYQVCLSKEEFEAVSKIVNKAEKGFSLNVYPEEYEINEVEEE